MRKLIDLLEEWQVHAPGLWENEMGPPYWWAVSNNDGIVAYFGDEADAFKFRWTKITAGILKETTDNA